MKRIIFAFLGLVFLILAFTYQAYAKWWIFGKSEEEVVINYLYINQISYDETDLKITLYRDLLQDGLIVIKGKASVKKGKIGAVEISIDGKETWHTAELSPGGVFNFSFRPDISRTYNIYVKVIDTRGKTNNVEQTHREVVVSESNILSTAKEVLDKIIDSYRKEDIVLFMSYVSEDFTPDRIMLEKAIRGDFGAFDNIDLRYTINNILSDAKGRVFISINFNRTITSARSGKTYSDKGTTEFVFKLTDKGLKLVSMKYPLIFGLSNAGEVISGIVQNPSGEKIIVVNERGETEKKPFDEAKIIVSEGEESLTIKSGTINLISAEHPPAGFSFEDGEVTEGEGDFVITGFCSDTSAYGFLDNGVSILNLGAVSLKSIKEVPASGYSIPPDLCLAQGHSYAFRLANGKYAIIEIKSVVVNHDVFPHQITVVFDYKYQTDGSRSF